MAKKKGPKTTGSIKAVKFHLRKGMSLTAACKAAEYGRGKLSHQRRKNPKLDAQILALMRGSKASGPGISITTKKQPHEAAVVEYWERWDKAAKAGTLVKEFGYGTVQTNRPSR